MQYGILNGQKVKASPEIKGAKCQCCDSDLVAKCGTVKIWHFAHSVKNNCSSWYKPMTEWHKQWQECFSEQYREIVHKDPETGEKHIADIKIPIAGKELVIEFQNSPISRKEVESRDKFYKDVIWVINGETFPTEYDRNRIGFLDFKYELQDIDGKIYQVYDNSNRSVCNIHPKTNYQEIKKFLPYQKFQTAYNKFTDLSNKIIYIDFGGGNMGFFKDISLRRIYYCGVDNMVELGNWGRYTVIQEITKEQFLKTFAR